jgi:hypothetical protein
MSADPTAIDAEETEVPRRRTRAKDKELRAMEDTLEVLEEFDHTARARIINWVASRYSLGELYGIESIPAGAAT